MEAVNQISQFVAAAHRQKEHSFEAGSPLDQEIDDLVDVIKVRLREMTVEEVFQTLPDKIFHLRFMVLERLAKDQKEASAYFEKINNEIARTLQLRTFSELAQIRVLILEFQNKMLGPVFEKHGFTSFGEALPAIEKLRPNYEYVRKLENHPSPYLRAYHKWVNSSLQVEFGMILSDLLLTNQIKFSSDRLNKELTFFLREALIAQGAYAMFLEFWQPDESDFKLDTPMGNIINQMTIFHAALQTKHQVSIKLSRNDLLQLLTD